MIRRFGLKIASLAILTTLTLPATSEALLASIKSTGMAGTATSYALDPLAGAYNPAAVSQIDDVVDAGGAWDQTLQQGTIKDNISGLPGVNGSFDAAKTKDFYVGEFGIKKSLDCRLALSLIVYNRSFVKTTYTTNFPLLGTSNMALEYLHQTISPIVTYKINKCLAVGASFNYNMQRTKVNGLETLNSATFTSEPGFVTNKGYSWSTGIGATIGIWGKIWNCLAFGAAYQPQTHMSKFKRYKGFLAQHGKFNIPQRVNTGISYEFNPCLTVCYDFEWVNWGQIKALSNGVIENLLVPGSLGTTNGAAFGFRDQYFHRVGANYKYNQCLSLRLGFRHVNLPFGRKSTAANLLICDTVQNFVTAGATYARDECSDFSIFYAYGFTKKVRGKDSIPLAGFGGGEADVKQKKCVLGIAMGRKL